VTPAETPVRPAAGILAARNTTLESFTPTERILLRRHPVDIGAFLCSGEYEIARWKEGEREGGGHGYRHRWTKTAIEGSRHEWLVDARYKDGRPWRWRDGELIWSARITYTRLLRWRATLPFGVLHAARVWYRMWPAETRDLPRLADLVLRVLAEPEPAEPAELVLFDLEETNA